MQLAFTPFPSLIGSGGISYLDAYPIKIYNIGFALFWLVSVVQHEKRFL